MSETLIDGFWRWFQEHLESFETEYLSLDTIDALDEKLFHLGVPGWKIGPGFTKDFAFVMSPEGERDLLPLTEKVISMAPELKHWEFHAAKPKKYWQPVIRVLNSVIDAQDWLYDLFLFPNNTFDITVLAFNLSPFDHLTRCSAAKTVLDGILGEAERMAKINQINVLIGSHDLDTQKFCRINTLHWQMKTMLALNESSRSPEGGAAKSKKLWRARTSRGQPDGNGSP